jgi:hypothetical protein
VPIVTAAVGVVDEILAMLTTGQLSEYRVESLRVGVRYGVLPGNDRGVLPDNEALKVFLAGLRDRLAAAGTGRSAPTPAAIRYADLIAARNVVTEMAQTVTEDTPPPPAAVLRRLPGSPTATDAEPTTPTAVVAHLNGLRDTLTDHLPVLPPGPRPWQ